MRYIVGGLLLVAGGLKVYGLGVSAVPHVGPWATPAIQSATAVWELVLGAWLLSGAAAGTAWLLAVGTFLSFAAISSYLGWIGQATCGCFGAINASPWHAFAVDMAALALLVVARPDRRAVQDDLLRAPTGFAGVLLGAGLILAVMAGAGSWVYGSPWAALSRLQGSPLYAPEHVDFGTGRPGDVLVREVPVTNWTAAPIRLIGGTSDCSCVVTKSLPAMVPPGGSITIPIRMKLPAAESGAFTRRAAIWTDCDRHPTVWVVLSAIVVSESELGSW